MEASLSNDDAIDVSGITYSRPETAVVSEVVQKEDTPVGKVGE